MPCEWLHKPYNQHTINALCMVPQAIQPAHPKCTTHGSTSYTTNTSYTPCAWLHKQHTIHILCMATQAIQPTHRTHPVHGYTTSPRLQYPPCPRVSQAIQPTHSYHTRLPYIPQTFVIHAQVRRRKMRRGRSLKWFIRHSGSRALLRPEAAATLVLL